MTKYTFMRDGVPEDVELEKWAWAVVYKDGTELRQFDKDGVTFHQFREIRRDDVVAFFMYDTATMDIQHTIAVTPGMTLFHSYKRGMLDQGGPNQRQITLYHFGYKKSGAEMHAYIYPSGKIVICDDGGFNLLAFGL